MFHIQENGDIRMLRLSQIAQFLNGYAFKSKNYADNGIRVIRIANVQDGYIVDDAPCFYPIDTDEDIEKYSLFAGDLLISLTGNVGRVGILPADMLPAALNQRVCCLRIDETIVDRKYLFYFLRQHQFMRDCVKASKGVAQLNLSTKWLADYEIPTPKIEEQKRIVARIEELFSELDNGVETLQKTKQQLAVYRQAVLVDAFKGDYPKVPLKTISQAMSGYAFKSKRYTADGQYTVVKIGNVKPFHFDFSRDLTKTNEIEGNVLDKYLLKKGDCLITLTGSRGKRDYGFVAMVADEENYLLNQRVAALRFNAEVALPEFYLYYLSSSEYRNQFFSYETGNVGQGNVGIKALTEPLVVCPAIQKQREILAEVEARLSTCDSIEKTVDTALQQAEAMRQSILKQAFEGRL
jgi:type I restriction enzyme S subunit